MPQAFTKTLNNTFIIFNGTQHDTTHFVSSLLYHVCNPNLLVIRMRFAERNTATSEPHPKTNIRRKFILVVMTIKVCVGFCSCMCGVVLLSMSIGDSKGKYFDRTGNGGFVLIRTFRVFIQICIKVQLYILIDTFLAVFFRKPRII